MPDLELPQTRQAHDEVGRTDVRPAVAGALTALVLATLAAVPLSGLFGSERAVDGWAELRGLGRGVAAVVRRDDGFFAANRALQAEIDDCERRLEDGSAVARWTRPWVQWLLATRGGVGNERVYLGRGGWLVLRDGFDYLTGKPFLDPGVLERRRRSSPVWREPVTPDPRPSILDFAAALAERGVRLLVLLVPVKGSVHPEALGGRPRELAEPAPQNPSLPRFREDLEAHGVPVFDATGTLRRVRLAGGHDAFLHTDSHWSPAGVEAVAGELAARVELLGIDFTAPRQGFRRATAIRRATGDLARALGLPAGFALRPPEEVEVQRVIDADPEGPAEVLLLGDSYANVYSDAAVSPWGGGAGIAEQLAYALERPVARIAVDGGGGVGARRRLARDAGRLAGVRLVILEVSMRELAVGDWPRVPVPPAR